MISWYSLDVAFKHANGSYFRDEWTTSTNEVGGTPEKWLLSIKKAATSQMHDSPESTPGLYPSLPNIPVLPRGLLGANASSSMGLKIAIFYLLTFLIS